MGAAKLNKPLASKGPALRAPRAARVAGTSPSIPYGDSALLPAGLSALRLVFASPVPAHGDLAHQEQRKQAAAEAHRVAERMTKAEADRDTARKEASSAREDAAKLRGQVEALQTQASDLMRALAAQ